MRKFRKVRRPILSQNSYNELVSSMRQCKALGYDEFYRFYDQLLTDHFNRGTLPKNEMERQLAALEEPQDSI